MSNGGDCRTAPATPGLLIIIVFCESFSSVFRLSLPHLVLRTVGLNSLSCQGFGRSKKAEPVTNDRRANILLLTHAAAHVFWIFWHILQCNYSYFWMEGWTFVELDKSIITHIKKS